ncbi:MAG: hypothetical protein KBA46_02680 [Candidatus Omnitrophica bacterium]|nr:hypothetical protein [Candidatus Omnitrophota bacterium]
MRNSTGYKKSFYGYFCALTILMLLFAGCEKRPIKNIQAQGSTIICFGDSITFGYGVERGEDYPAALAKILGRPVLNQGIDGDTAEQAFARFQSDVLDRNPSLVILEFGGNDFLENVPLSTTINTLRKMVQLAQAKGALVAVADVSAGLFMLEYRFALRKLAADEGALFIPELLKGIITNPSLKSEFLHPNKEGYQLIAERVSAVIQPYLSHHLQSAKK